jgi:hypothetical protein
MGLVFQFAKSLLSQKLRERFRTHASFDKLVDHVPAEILPAEVGGQIPMQVMIDQWKAVLEERREAVLALDLVEYGVENSTTSTTSETKNDLTTSAKQRRNSNTSSTNDVIKDVMTSVCHA